MLRIGKQKPFKELQSKDDWMCLEDVTFDRKIKHAKSIICGKLYNTEKSEIVSCTQDKRVLFMTEKGNYFSCSEYHNNYTMHEGNKAIAVREISYADIRPESAEYARENIGRYVPEKYIELFGEVEEA